MVINIILAILVLSIIIIIHEFGHFIVAKANGITQNQKPREGRHRDQTAEIRRYRKDTAK